MAVKKASNRRDVRALPAKGQVTKKKPATPLVQIFSEARASLEASESMARACTVKKMIFVWATLLVLLVTLLGLSGCEFSLKGDVQEVSHYTNAQEVTKKQAKELVVSRVEGSSRSEITEMKEGVEEGYLVYTGKLVHDDREYSFTIDESTGNITNWQVSKAKQ